MQDVVREMVVKISFAINSTPMQKLNNELRNLERHIERVRRRGLSQMNSGFDGAAKYTRRMAGGLVAASAGLGLFLNEAGQFNKTQIAFETMTGSMEIGRDLLKEMHDFALITPFSVKDVEDNAAMLLGMGIEANKVKSTMKALGDVASGINRPLGMVALNYGQIKTRGVLMGTELRDFARQGVPIIAQLAEQLGVNQSAIQDMASAREISFEEVEKAFKAMTSSGGRFHDLMIKQAKTWPVMISNFLIWLRFIARDIGQKLLPAAKAYLEIITKWISAHRELLVSKVSEYMKVLFRWVVRTAVFIIKLAKVTYKLVKAFGGFERVLKMIVVVLGSLIALNVANMIGGAATALVGFTAQLALAFVGVGSFSGALAMWPAIIVLAVAAIALLAQDIKVFAEGGDSAIGALIKKFETFARFVERVRSAITGDWFPKGVGDAVAEGVGTSKKRIGDLVSGKTFSNSRGASMGWIDSGYGVSQHHVSKPNMQKNTKTIHQNITIPINGSGDPAATAKAVKTVLEGTTYSELYDNSTNYAVSPTGN